MKKLVFVFLVLVLTVSTGCKKTDSGLTGGGEIVRYSLMASYTAQQLDSIVIKQVGFSLSLVGLPILNGAEQYLVYYKSYNEFNELVTATGVVYVPIGRTVPAPMFSYGHGTNPNKDGAISTGNGEGFVALVAAGIGYISTAPDYLGMGYGDGLHAYCHKQTEANCVVDLLRAAKKIIKERNVAHNGQLFLTGYSQGGHVAMSAHQEIETKYSNEFTVTASAPMAGPYDMSGAMVTLMLDTALYPDPFYLPFLLVSYQRAYKLYPSVNDFIASPYDTSLIPYFDGNYNKRFLNPRTANPPIGIIKPEVVAAFTTDSVNHPFRVRLRENDNWRWVNRAPIRFIYSKGDDHVPYQNAINCRLHMIERGADPNKLILDQVSETEDHNGAAQLSVLSMVNYFNSLRTDQ
jgi:hypothetical protein